MSTLSKFKFNTNAFAALKNDALFEGSGTSTIRLGKKVPYNASINGIKLQAFVTLLEPAKLTRISLSNQTQVSTLKPYKIAEGIFKPARMAIDLVIDGEEMSLMDLLYRVSCEAEPSLTREQFNINSRKMGFNYADGMPLFWHQFGANAAAYEELVELFTANGGKPASVANNKRIESVYTHDSGIDVVQFEVGTVDRSKSPRNQGFLDFVDAQVGQFERILSMRLEADMLNKSTDGLSQAQIKANAERAKTLDDMSRQWISSWGGAQQRLVNDGTGSFSQENQYDPVKVPCGRLTLDIKGDQHAIDLWTNKSKANSSEATSSDSKPNVAHAFDS